MINQRMRKHDPGLCARHDALSRRPAVYRIESRWPDWARWRIVTAAPHSERHAFDNLGLRFPSRESAQAVADSMARCNAGEYRVTTTASS